MTARFDDWSPASVFGVTTPESKKLRRRSFRDPCEQELHQTDSNRLQGDEGRAVAPTSAARKVSTNLRQHESRLTSTRGHEQFATAGLLSGSKEVDITLDIEKYEDNSASGGGTTSLADHGALPTGRKSRRDSRQLHNGAEGRLATSIQADERNLAASVIQKHARVLLLRRREKESLQEVNALRLILNQAAASLLTQYYRRYRSRRAIRAYLSCWYRQESQIQELLRQVQTKKRKREAAITTTTRQRHQEQLHARRQSASVLISQWSTTRVLLRQYRKKSQKRRAIESQRRIACWYRRRKLSQRCQERAQHSQQHQAALRIQQTYRQACRRRAEHLRRRLVAKKAICCCAQRFLARQKNRRRRLEFHSALEIQIFYQKRKKLQDARLELARRRQVYCGVQVLSAIVYRRKIRRVYPKWLAVCKVLQQQELQRQNTSAQLLQLQFRAFVAHRKRIRQHSSAISIQRAFQGYHARQLCRQLRKQRRKLAKKRRKQSAATKMQSQIRGFLARLRFAKLIKQLRDRFRCSNCGVIEPSGVYCKLCGRKRTNFDQLVMDNKRALLLYSGPRNNDSSTTKSPGDLHKGVGSGVLHLAPVRPASPPSFPKLQASKNGKLRAHMAARGPSLSNNNQQEAERPQDLTLPAALGISGFSLLPMVLSLRHAAAYGTNTSVPAKHPHNRPISLFKPTTNLGSNNQAEVLYTTPNRPLFAKSEPRAVSQTKLRAQTLVSLQFQQQELSQTHALTQHLHRLQRASHAVSRSR